MLASILVFALFLVVGGLILYGAVTYRGREGGREVLWTGAAALLLAVVFAFVR